MFIPEKQQEPFLDKCGPEETGGYDWSDRRVSVAAWRSQFCFQLSVSSFPRIWELKPAWNPRSCLQREPNRILVHPQIYAGVHTLKFPQSQLRLVRLPSHCSHQAVLFSGLTERILVPWLVSDLGELWEAFAFTRRMKDSSSFSLLLRL